MTTYSEHQVGDLTVVVKRDRHRKYTARVYRGNALAGLLKGLRAIKEFVDG